MSVDIYVVKRDGHSKMCQSLLKHMQAYLPTYLLTLNVNLYTLIHIAFPPRIAVDVLLLQLSTQHILIIQPLFIMDAEYQRGLLQNYWCVFLNLAV